MFLVSPLTLTYDLETLKRFIKLPAVIVNFEIAYLKEKD